MILAGCYSKTQSLPSDIFNDIAVFQKPKEAITIGDINKSYIDLYEACGGR